MRSKGMVIFLAMVGVIAAALAVNYFRPSPSSAAAIEHTTASQPDDLIATPNGLAYNTPRGLVYPPTSPYATSSSPVATPVSQPAVRSSRTVPKSGVPITVQCGETLVTIHAEGNNGTQPIKVDCSPAGQTVNQPVMTSRPLAVEREAEPVAVPVAQRSRVRQRTSRVPAYDDGYYTPSDDRGYYPDDRPVYRNKRRSWQKEALIIGGGAGAGAAIGAIAGGGKGAGIGAATGGVAGLIYDLATRNKKERY